MRRPIELVVVADDITGSLDTGVQFARLEAGVVVTVWPSFPAGDAAGIVVVDTESRHLPVGEARRRVESVVRSACERNVRLLYKKVDSTLRGNVGAELEGMLSASGRERIAFAPAYPQMGRTTVGGRQFVNGTPLDRSSFARDPLNPAWTSSIAEIISAQSRLPVAVCGTLQQATTVDSCIVVLDAQSGERLREAARELYPQRDRWVFAGSAGFADALSREMSESHGAAANGVPGSIGNERTLARATDPGVARPATGGSGRRALVVIGSVSPVSMAQADYLSERGIPTFLAAGLDSRVPNGSGRDGRGELLSSVHEGYAVGDVVIVRTSPGSGNGNETDNLGAIGFPARVGELARAIAMQERPDVVVVLGGDTLIGIMQAFEIEGLAPVEEILPGVPVSLPVASGSGWTPRLFVSKAGGFGPPDTVAQILTRLGIEPGRKQGST